MAGSTALILGALTQAAMAYAGLGAAALPIVIHLFNRRRFRRIRWAATDFLLEAERRNRRRMRIEELILLGLRCLAMALLGMVLARWFVQPRSLIAWLGSAARTNHFIVVDDSYSMGAGGPRRVESSEAQSPAADTVFADARRAALAIVEHVRQVAPEDSITLLAASRPDEPIRTASSVAQVPPGVWGDDVQSLQPSYRAGNMPAALKAVRDLLEARSDVLHAAVYVVSDFQSIDWLNAGPQATRAPSANPPSATSDPTTTSGPAAVLAGWTDRNRRLELLLVDVGRGSSGNRAITAITPAQRQAVAGVVGRYTVRVVNFGTEASKPGELRVFMGDTAVPPLPVPGLAPNQSADVPVELAFGQEGSQRITVELEPDVLPADDLRSSAVAVSRALRLLLVNGEASPDPYQDEAFLLNVALRPEGPEFSGNETTIINETELEFADLADYHAVLLLNVNRVTREMADRLEQFALAGGGVIFFLGDQVDATVYNRLLYRGGNGILPAGLGDQLTLPPNQTGPGLASTESSEPAFLRLGAAGTPLLGDARVWQCFHIDVPDPEATRSAWVPALGATRPTSLQDASAPSSDSEGPAFRPVRVLLRLKDTERTPLLVERPFGRGRILMFTSAADKEWNNLPDQPFYVVLMMEMTQYVARSSDASKDQFVGEPIRLALDPADDEPAAVLRLPTYPDTPAVRLEAHPEGKSGRAVLEWTDTARPGLYQFDIRKTSGETRTRQVAVNLDPREADLRRADRANLIASMPGLSVSYVTGERLKDQAPSEDRQELWPLLLGMLIGVLMLEQGLAWWFGADKNWRRAVRWTAS